MENKAKLFFLWGLILSLGLFVNEVGAVNPESVNRVSREAIMDGSNKEALKEMKIDRVCNRLEVAIDRMSEKIGIIEDKSKEIKKNRLTEMEKNKDTREAQLQSRWTLRDENRNKFYAKLDARVENNEAKKAAVEKFKDTVDTAVEARRTAIGEARKVMQSGIDVAIRNREMEIESIRKNLQSDLDKIFIGAKNSCQDDSDNEDVKNALNQLRVDVKESRDAYRSEVVKIKAVKDIIEQLRATRKETVASIIDEFKITLKSAQEELKSVMNV
jgi:hypothetical protein